MEHPQIDNTNPENINPIPLTKSGQPDKRYLPKNNKTRNRKTTYRKIDPDKTKQLIRQGVPLSDIAKMQNVNKSTITRFKDKHSQEFQELEEFKNHKADILADTQLQTNKARRRLITAINEDVEDEAFSAIPFAQKSKAFRDLTISQATDQDKEKAERGEAKEYIGIQHAMVAHIKVMEQNVSP